MAAALAWFGSFLVYILATMSKTNNLHLKRLACVVSSNAALGFASELLATLELREIGVRWSNVGEGLAPDDPQLHIFPHPFRP